MVALANPGTLAANRRTATREEVIADLIKDRERPTGEQPLLQGNLDDLLALIDSLEPEKEQPGVKWPT
jgi:hypothetical protein